MLKSERLSVEHSSTGLKVALRIMEAWGATPSQTCSVLRISTATYRRASQGQAAGGRLDIDQLQRIGFVLGIHASLRTIFDNPSNVEGFPTLKNDNTFFDGRSPLDIMAQGDMISIYQTYKHIEQLTILS
ncbi:antitoxin Xre-like helix-turn-helix domain-containing protein [Pseudomonas fulva]|uniref:antitoxin Xre-like helix-turn-helix domain-containing protein n=1 Tax=Pseudomonas fulva TaxID=47880 RepID=UPI002DBABC6A|nr:antitoxin Xre-like helix-turn-helix domain-containing protein [Pseudomonas fulva]MEB8056096.1 hypothetical protein [Pseudomonas fulva]